MSASSPQRWCSHVRRVSWSHPEWWALSCCAAAWLLLLSRAVPLSGGMQPLSHGHSHGHGGHAAATQSMMWTAELFWWLVMIAAMMLPMVVDPIRTTAARSLWRRRHRAICGFLIGYVGPWMAFGVGAAVMVSGLRMQTGVGTATATALAFSSALLWQTTAMKRRAVLACHRTQPIASDGWRADRDCVQYGWFVGRKCLVSCWALMLACLVAGHGLPAMACATAIGWAERHRVRPNERLLYGAIALVALAYAAMPFL